MKEVSSQEDRRTLQERYRDNFYARLLGYSTDIAYRQMINADDAERDLSQRRSLDQILSTIPCSVCLCEHHPSADCPADDEVRRFNESQEDTRDLDMYHRDDFY